MHVRVILNHNSRNHVHILNMHVSGYLRTLYDNTRHIGCAEMARQPEFTKL